VRLGYRVIDGACPVVERGASRSAIAAERCAVFSIRAVIGSFATFLSGCSSAPSRNILGSYFPSWMICALIGLAATVAVRALLAKAGIDGELPAPIVVYLAFATAFSLAVWLLWLA
jgi:YtcA family